MKSTLAIEGLKTSLLFACEALSSCDIQLNRMDTGADGDTDSKYPIKLLRTLSSVAEKDMGGTSGAFYSIFFSAVSHHFSTNDINGDYSLSKLIEALDEGTKAISKYGKSHPGDRTMLDALVPYISNFKSSSDEVNILLRFDKATTAAEEGAMKTLKMKAKVGRASRVAVSELIHSDPGAHAVGIICRAVNEALKRSSSEEMRSKLKAFKFDDADRRSRPGGFPLHHSNSSCNSINNSNSHLRFASSIIEQESKLNEIMSHTGLLQTPEGNKVKAYIEDFELLGDLGNGTCGHVVKMQHRPTGQIIAVKQMRRTGDADENKRIIMDLDVVLKSHDCREIVLCLGAFITDSDVWICMELMSTCFDKLLKHIKAPIPEDICGKVAVATVNALNYLKERHGVIHRDVKPSNILLEASGCVKLCDFGISGRLVDSKAKTRSAGCAAYMAPERIDPPNPSQPDYDIRADVWSLGITLVELATGYFPYRDCKTDFEVLTKVLTDDPPLLPRNGGFFSRYEEMDVDVGAWYRNKTEPHEVNSTQNVSPSTATVSEPVTFKPQPSPRVVRSSRRPPQSPSGYPSAMSRLTASPTVSTSSITTSNSAFDPTSIKHHYDSRRYPSNGGTSSYSSLLNTSSSSNRSPQYLSSSSGPTSLPEVLSRPSITPRYRESPRMPRKFDFTFPTTLYSIAVVVVISIPEITSCLHIFPITTWEPKNSSTEDRSGYPRFSNRMHHHHRPSLGGEQPSSLSKNNPRSPSNERASTTPGGGRAGIHSNVPSSSNTTTSTTNSGSGFSWRNILQSPMSLRRLRTSSTDRSSAFDSARRFQPSYRKNVQELRDLLYHEKLNEFLDDGNTMVLSANAESADSKIYLDSKPHIDNDGSQPVLLFFKMKPTVINEDNLKSEVFTSSMVNSPVSTLYYTLHSVYSPLLLSDSKWSNDFDPKLQPKVGFSLLSELEKGLGSIVRQGEHNYNKNDSHEIPSASILSPSDEIQYWEDLSQYAKRQDLRSMGAHFHEVLEPLGREFDNLKNLQIEEAIDVLESCHAVLDDLWKVEQWNYPQKRMNHLFDIIANSMTRFIQFKISSSIDIWKDPFSKVEALLLEGVNICDEVHDLCTKLTTIYWPNYGPYQWKGGSYAPERTKKMKNRLTEILSLRKTYKQITQLLSEDERLELQTSNIFEHFEGMNPIHYNPYTDSQWRSRVQRFEEGLSPTENLPYKNLNVTRKLIKRKSIAKNLDVERESLLSKLQEYLRKEKVNFNDGNPKVPSLKDVQSPTINNVYFIRQLHAKLEDIQRTGETMLLDLSSWKLFDEQLKQFIAELSEYQKDQFDSWVRDNTEAIEEEDGLFLKTSQQVVYFEAGKKDMKVSYNPRLIGLTREVRMLNVLGFAIPHKIQLATDLAKKFSKQAQQLDQIAVFHNTIGDRIIQSQKPMMLDSAIDLANCVRDQSNMTWDNSDLIQSYINALRSKVDDFARLNNRLSSYHKKVRDIVIKLMDTDLLNDNEIWKDSLKIIRQVFLTMLSSWDQNAHRFSHLFEKAEELFKKLEQVKNRFEEWVALGSIDSMEEFIQSHCHTAEDFKRNFQASKAKAQEIGRLSTKTEEKIDCILILFGPVLSEIELLNRKYWDYLSLVLQKSVVNDIDQIETFAQNAIQSLGKLPQTVEEIGECNTRHREYVRKTPEIMDLYNSADTKNRILIAWTNETMDKISKVENIWNNYSSAMDNYETSVSHQMESVKANLQTQVDNMNREIEHFKIRSGFEGFDFYKRERTGMECPYGEKRKLQKDSGHFELNTEFPLYEEINKDLEHYKGMWALYEDFHQSKNELANEEWILFRSKMFKLEDFLNSWSDKLTGSSEVNSIREIFSDIHWSEMFNLLSMPPKSIEKLTLGDFLKVNQVIIEYSNELAELNNRASGEVIIRQTLNELDIWEIESKFAFSEHLASNGEKVPLIKDWNDLLSKVGDNQVLFQSIKGSPYYERFGDRATSWEIKLADLDEVLNNLNGVQRKWIYLEPYQEQMKLKTSGFNYKEVFRKIDDDFRLIMSDAIRDNRVSSLLKISSIKSILNSTIDRLEKCQRSLNEFLEEKRSLFPRFYFIGDEDLLAILGQASKPEVIQNHLRKLFSGVHREEVTLLNAIQISNQAEVWLTLLSREIVHTLRQLLSECLFDSNNKGSSSQKGHEMDPLKYPSQVLCLSDSILFTKKTEESIRKRNLESYLRSLKEQLNSYTSVKLRGEDDAEEESSNVVLELKLKVLILEKINSISIVENLISQNVDSVDHWEWQKRLRYYHSHDDKSVSVAMADAEFEYTFEYQGNAQKLVHTPLTEKCYLTLTQAMKIGLGGNPYGPAGTGKTESVKALGGLFGRQVLVFNCDEGIDITSMGRIFIGLIKCGAWDVLMSSTDWKNKPCQQFPCSSNPIQFALKSKDRRVHLMDKEVELSLNTGIFVTMNPAGKGYGGRQKLPDNLKTII
ncbi:Dual specificity mitogen-activated protein kinase kinase mek-1,Dual specificity mitogen-activated protein kinase kinase mek-2,Dual specificity mitogen-activated protein kinase kinase dSOR1,Dual specificity mitogen-activated protein kinase kinase 4,Dual specificity mitogen-activated protein kinase kinase 3,Dual specificity protein kinase FUZ7,Dual specificity mitogen-activated protein kinase kinase 5,Dual specificity mitogen-activated protein kinase kinase sek-1,MAP kinase kinase PBS2,Dual specificity mitog|uniref:Uncharacterized protein n=1 Tax=Lepeophtheirus salmonis TaxID=72036 RepID=A0A7R8CWA1_LEPSM|nr:Dual specificity mitogen-activated protein kinase kinase mek-1,Dual specificity mitogen-activated protein kinase kinase mek-2,Dual specificity mitogen-activated protein kinase kinase dSOR1,Dual specificity mitogen-activated protein kinase kinase 4,Dual specificity mitogen-activated protein kinase kinase 3,Dual specificity protein kinase FUZ7,Dual specificity mitogen-activated protein kinase kinase 5,Dual specificity mitogen-activated protein kinase kinase sek-1,MAP kinase kinase PBS2,Dual specif